MKRYIDEASADGYGISCIDGGGEEPNLVCASRTFYAIEIVGQWLERAWRCRRALIETDLRTFDIVTSGSALLAWAT